MKAHILVVDDDPRITDLLRRILAYEGYSVAIAANGNAALTRTLERAPDLIVLDVMLPGIDGLEVARRLRAAGDMVPILMLTARDAIMDRVKGLETGADDYLIKPFANEELVARVKAMLRRNLAERQEVLHYADVELDTGTRVAHRGAREIELSPTEYELLALFLRRPRQVLTREIILDRVWGMDFEGSSNVMEVYVGYLRAKLEAQGETRLILARADASVDSPRAISKQETSPGSKTPQTQPIELDHTVLQLIRQLRGRLSIEDAKPKLEVGHIEPVRIQGDEESVRRILLILLDNALKYTASNDISDIGRVIISLERTEKEALLRVRDTGIGIDPDDLPHIFERFYRADRARSRQGTGLGLSIAQTLVEQLGGHITTESVPGQGSTFSVWFPLA